MRAKGLWLAVIVGVLAIGNVSNAAEWVKYSCGYRTKQTIPKGTEIRIRVTKAGAQDQPKLVRYWGTSNVISEDKSKFGNVTTGQVLTYKLKEPMQIGIEVGGLNYSRKGTGVTPSGDYDRLTFKGGWVLDVKIVSPPF